MNPNKLFIFSIFSFFSQFFPIVRFVTRNAGYIVGSVAEMATHTRQNPSAQHLGLNLLGGNRKL